MKVCTDSCLFGAVADVTGAETILDIGAGTGLLSLMAAQRAPAARVDAVEIDAAAAAQAAENFRQSPWPERLRLHHTRLQDFSPQQPYDLILTNPPFFPASQKSPDEARNVAMHASELRFAEIIAFSKRFLKKQGKLWVLLPPAEAAQFATEAVSAGFCLSYSLRVLTRTNGKHIRTVQEFTFEEKPLQEQTIAIRTAGNDYTPEFTALLKDFYLIF